MSSDPSETVVHTENLTRTFGDASAEKSVTAVNRLTLDVFRGEVLGILGHNGAGKTTTVRLLNGVLRPTSGRLRVLGYDPLAEGASLRRHTGVLTETPSLDEKLTGRENLTIYARLYGVEEAAIDARVSELLDTFGLDDRAQDVVGSYSKGMKQRLALARTLLHNPRLIFLDEPTAGLDPVATRSVHNLIRHLSQGRSHTILLCTHNLVEAQRLCHRVAVMEWGRLVALGTPADLARDLWQGMRLEIELDPGGAPAVPLPAEARDAAWDAKANVLSLRVADRDAVPARVTRLGAAGRLVYRVTPDEPTLEDVYFALHEQAEKRGNDASE